MSFLERIDKRRVRIRVYRLTSYKKDERFLSEQEYDVKDMEEIVELVSSHAQSDFARVLCDLPFERRRGRRRGRSGRFSDGSFPVFYGALEASTADREILYWFSKGTAGRPKDSRTAYYFRLSCLFSGNGKDLRPMHKCWPQLTSDDYEFCQKLGMEAAKVENLDGLLTPSAREVGGTNVPIFKRRAIGDASIETRVAITLNASTGMVSMYDVVGL